MMAQIQTLQIQAPPPPHLAWVSPLRPQCSLILNSHLDSVSAEPDKWTYSSTSSSSSLINGRMIPRSCPQPPRSTTWEVDSGPDP
ncbi:hypothetical protein ACFX19_037708 [Malus domestica]